MKIVLSLYLLLLFIFCWKIPSSYAKVECMLYNRAELVSPCGVYNPSQYAYIDTNVTTLEDQMSYMMSTINILKGLVSEPVCRAWITTWYCQEPTLTGHVKPMQCCVTSVFGEVLSPPTVAPTCKDMCDVFHQS